MDDIGPRLGRFGTTARLFTLVSGLPRDQQLILLKGLLGDRIVAHLYKLVLDLSEEEQQLLMDQLLETPSGDLPETTLTIDEDETRIRQVDRTSCRLRAVCVADGVTFEALITDISMVGMFIQADRSLPAGKAVRVGWRLPGVARPLILNAQVQRSEPGGIGLRLQALTPEQESAIRAFIAAP